MKTIAKKVSLYRARTMLRIDYYNYMRVHMYAKKKSKNIDGAGLSVFSLMGRTRPG